MHKGLSMEKIEIQIISRDTIKPTSPQIHLKEPYKFCVFNQLTPFTYTPLIFFYSTISHSEDAIASTTRSQLIQIKNSLSEALNLYYPFSGRVNNNLLIDRFDEGVPFATAKVGCRMKDFLNHQKGEFELLNKLLPRQPFAKEVEMDSPILVFQANVFTCGAIALGLVASHKIFDGPTGRAFISVWTAIAHGRTPGKNQVPELSEPSEFFPPRKSFPPSYLSLMENLWFTEANYLTRRFVFGGKSIAALREKGKGEKDAKRPSRVETLTAFIWRCCMDASKEVSLNASRPSILVEAVNLRTRTNPRMSDTSVGDIFWWAQAVSNPTDSNTELHNLVGLLKEAIAFYGDEYAESLQGEEGFETLSGYFEQLEGLFASEKPDIFAFTCWSYLGFTKLNFGWGDPFWVGLMGKVGPEFRNLIVLIETQDGKGMEAWITLDAPRMAAFERHPELLAFASPNPLASCL